AGAATTTMQKVLKEEPLPPSTLNVQLPPAMDAVVRKALAKRADERFQTAHEFADAIRAAAPAATATVAAVPVAHSDPTLIAAADATAANAATPPVKLQPAQPPASATASAKPSQTTAIAIVVAAAVIVVGAGAWFVYQRQS